MFFNFFSRKWWASPRKGKEIWKKEALYLRKAVDRLAKAAKASGRLQARPHARRRASVDEGIIEIFGSSYGSLVTWEPLKICRNISIDRFVLVGLGDFGVSWEGLGRRETDFGQNFEWHFLFFGGGGEPLTELQGFGRSSYMRSLHMTWPLKPRMAAWQLTPRCFRKLRQWSKPCWERPWGNRRLSTSSFQTLGFASGAFVSLQDGHHWNV